MVGIRPLFRVEAAMVGIRPLFRVEAAMVGMPGSFRARTLTVAAMVGIRPLEVGRGLSCHQGTVTGFILSLGHRDPAEPETHVSPWGAGRGLEGQGMLK